METDKKSLIDLLKNRRENIAKNRPPEEYLRGMDNCQKRLGFFLFFDRHATLSTMRDLLFKDNLKEILPVYLNNTRWFISSVSEIIHRLDTYSEKKEVEKSDLVQNINEARIAASRVEAKAGEASAKIEQMVYGLDDEESLEERYRAAESELCSYNEEHTKRSEMTKDLLERLMLIEEDESKARKHKDKLELTRSKAENLLLILEDMRSTQGIYRRDELYKYRSERAMTCDKLLTDIRKNIS